MLFIGAIGKSAQIPLFIWLPDAMAGPTPVSALIHAATMVTAGVYLLVRVNPILAASADWLPWVIAIVGCATAFLAATIAIAQTDIKKVLAYSTVSQLGYMFLAVGSGGYSAAIFHMITHAFFKACLFLGAGSVIHGMHDQQDMRFMGALRKIMPITAITFMIGWLAISGVIPFSGFWSKDDVLVLRPPQELLPLPLRPHRRPDDGLLHEPRGHPRLLRQGPLGRERRGRAGQPPVPRRGRRGHRSSRAGGTDDPHDADGPVDAEAVARTPTTCTRTSRCG